jgi:uncharacterized protein (TIGR02246 family)
MYVRLLTVALAACLAASPAHAQRARPSAATADATETFRPLVERYFTALGSRNLSNLDSLYGPAGAHVFFDIVGEPVQGWEAYKTHRAKLLEEIGALQLVPTGDLRASRQGNVAWTSTTFRGTVASRGHGVMRVTGRQSAVWERRGSDWLIVHEHLSIAFPDVAAVAERFPAPDAPGEAERQVREIFSTYATAWNGGQAADLAALWQPDGDVVVIGAGAATEGRDRIAQMWSETMARRAADFATVLGANVTSARFVERDVAVVDGEFAYWKGQANVGAPAARERFSAVVTRTDATWRIVTLRVASVPPPPAPARRR